MKKVLIAVVIVMFVSGVFTGAFAAEDMVKIGYLRLVMSLPTFVAEEKEFFSEEGIKVDLVALVAGRIDANCGSATSGHWFAEQNVPDRYKIFLVYGPDALGDNTFVVVVRRDSPIKDFKGFNGKKVGHFPGATSRALAKAVRRHFRRDSSTQYGTSPGCRADRCLLHPRAPRDDGRVKRGWKIPQKESNYSSEYGKGVSGRDFFLFGQVSEEES
jgi:hypothetical protein